MLSLLNFANWGGYSRLTAVVTTALIASSTALAQNTLTIKGVVTDSKQEPLIGVNVRIKGTTHGVATDLDGKFTLAGVPRGATLEFSYIGMEAQRVVVRSQAPLTVVLRDNAKELNDVVVVGYGTTSKRAMISSVSTVDAKQMEGIPLTNMTQGLAGRSKGLIVTGSGGGINKQQSISIRGGGTPLVVIDGVIRDYQDFVNLSPEDIEAFSVLKDASATAVYGARATNGILQVTTKKGALGKPSFEYSLNQSFAQPAIWPEMMDSWDRARYANIAKKNDGLPDAYSEERINKMRDGSDPLNNGNWKWRDLVLRNWAPQTKHLFRMTGGNESNRYYVSLGNINQRSLYKSDTHYMNRTNFRLSLSPTFATIGLKATATLDGYVQKEYHPYSSTASGYYQVFSHIQDKSPLTPALNKYGLPYNTSDNPVSETSADAGFLDDRAKAINGNVALEWAVPKITGLSLRANANYRYSVSTQKAWRLDARQYDWESEEGKRAGKPLLQHTTSTATKINMQLFAAYKRTFGEHTFDALAGFESTRQEGDTYWEKRENYLFEIPQMRPGPADTQTNDGYEWELGRAGFIAQLKYNYANRYFVEFALRHDGSDNFPKDKRWGTFYSGSLGWIISDEAFMQRLKERHILDQLKVRASYGLVGLDNWGSPYALGRFEYLPSYNLNTKGAVINGNYTPVFTEGAIPSPDITWFSTKQSNVGLDFSALSNRLYGSFDYFYYSTSGFLYAPDPKEVGYTAPLGLSLPRVSTDGELRRSGYEFQIGWRDHLGALSYDLSATYTTYRQMWNRQPAERDAALRNPYTRSTQEYNYYGNLLENQGYYSSTEDVYNSVWPTSSRELTAGDIKYLDFNGDGKIDGADNHRLGRPSTPRGNYGININLGYKGWSLSMLFQGSTAFNLYAGNAIRMNSSQTLSLPIIYDFQTDYWTPENRSAKFPRLMSSPARNGSNNYLSSDFWLISGTYVRFKDFKFGYDFKYSLLKRVKFLDKVQLSISGQNLFTLSEAVKYGLDPENSSTENYGYPNERVLALSLNIGF